jgi:anti-sigma B factor antagonist
MPVNCLAEQKAKKEYPVNRLTLKNRTAMEDTSVTVIDLEGELDGASAPDFDAHLKKTLDQKKFKIVLNMEHLTYVSSTGFGSLVAVIDQVRKNKGDIKLAQMLPEVYEVIKMLEFDKVFQTFKTEDNAVRAF